MVSVPTGDASTVLQQCQVFKNSSDTNGREYNSDSCRCIPDVSQEINSESSTEDVLCTQCLDFHSRCLVPSRANKVVPGISTVGAALSNEKCPSCRLIARCIRSHPRAQPIPPELHILLWSGSCYLVERTGDLDKRTDELWLVQGNTRLWLQSPKSKEFWLKDKEEIGVLLPVMKDSFKDITGLTGPEALFNTLECQGLIFARPIAHTVDVELLRTWMNFCAASHGSCRIKKASNDASTKLRLIDVVERRLVDATLAEEFIALSYVWGPSNNKVLMKGTLRCLQEKGSLNPSTVPRLVADVMDFVAEVGERYLWIDTACIIQDDPLDKQRQLPNMSSIYTHAKFTIAAAVEGANDPLPRWKNCQHKVSVPIESIKGLAYTVGGTSLSAALAQTTWNRRGWTFQEALLARRLLVFTQNLIYWSCREESWCEDQYAEFHNLKNQPTRKTSLFATRVWDSSCAGSGFISTKLCAMRQYARHAEQYSCRSFSNYSDVVWAFLGVLISTRENFPNGYIWALPYDQLDAGLLWLTCYERTQCVEHQYDLGSESRLPIPSWCWIGKGQRIWFATGICETKSRVTWHKTVTCWSPGIDNFDDNQELMLSSTQSTTKDNVVFDYAFLHFTAQTTMLWIQLENSPNSVKNFVAYFSIEKTDPDGHSMVEANIFSPSNIVIGQILVPARIFQKNMPHLGEFVLLSEYTGNLCSESCNKATHSSRELRSEEGTDHDRVEDDVGSPHQKEYACEDEKGRNQECEKEKKGFIPEEHREDCSHQPALNVMLIEWDETHNIKNFARRVGIARIDPSAWEEVVATEKMIVLG